MKLKRTPRYIFVGPKAPAQFFDKQVAKDWDLVGFYETIFSLNEDIDNLEAADAVITLDALYWQAKDENVRSAFIEMVTSLSPSAFFGIFEYSPNPAVKEEITERIIKANDLLNSSVEDSSEIVPNEQLCYYFLDKADPIDSLSVQMEEFLENCYPNARETVEYLTAADEEDEPEESSVDDVAKRLEEESGIQEVERDEDSPYFGRLITVTSTKGGSGKSTTSLALAAYLSEVSKESVAEGLEDRSFKVALVDMDVADGQIAYFTGLDNKTIIHLHEDAQKEGKISKDILQKYMIKSDNLGFDVLLASHNPSNHRILTNEFYENLFIALRNEYDFIILDTSVQYLSDVMTKVCLPSSDKILFICEPIVSSVGSMKKWVRYVAGTRQLGINKNKIRIVLNKYLGGSSAQYGNRNLSGEEINKNTGGVEIEAVIPSIPSLVASAANSRSMNKLIENEGFKESITPIAEFVISPSEYELP